jgi:zinc protease
MGGRVPRAAILENAVTPDAPFRQKAPAAGPERPVAMPKLRDDRLGNGLRFLLVENHQVPIVAITLAISRGAAVARPGLASLARKMLGDGTEVRDAGHLTQAFHTIGAEWDGSTYQGSIQLEYLVLPSGVEELLALITEMLRRPDPPDSEFESTRNWFLSFVGAESPSDRMDEAVAAALYPAGHPYRFDPSGTLESLKTFRKADAIAFLRDHVAPDQIVIVGAGDVAWSTFSEMVKKGFGDWRAAAVSEPALPAIVPLSGDAPIRVVDRPGATQAEIRIVALAPPRDSADVVPLQLLADALGGNFMSRFQQNLRETHAYSYWPHTTIYFRRDAGEFTAMARVPNNNVGQALGEMARELDRVRTEDLTPAELDLAKAARIVRLQAGLSTRSVTASTLASLLANHRPVDDHVQSAHRTANMKAAELRAVAQRYLQPGQRRIFILGDAKTIRSQLLGQRVEVLP